MSRSEEFEGSRLESLGHPDIRIITTEMPENVQYTHKLSEFGTPIRLHAINPTDPTTRRVTDTGNIEAHPEGIKGLVGIADVYHNPERKGTPFMVTHVDKNGNEISKGLEQSTIPAAVNVGWMRSIHPGVGRALFNHINNMVPQTGNLNYGEVMSPKIGSMLKKAVSAEPLRFRYKNYFEDR